MVKGKKDEQEKKADQPEGKRRVGETLAHHGPE
jgi:hypothetical protein